jgi:hypothetical protein
MSFVCMDSRPAAHPTWTGLGFDANQAYVVLNMVNEIYSIKKCCMLSNSTSNLTKPDVKEY